MLRSRGLGVLRAFASAFKVRVGDIEFGIKAETGTADSGTLESDLPELLLAVAAAAREARNAVALFVDEVQYLSGEDLGALIVSAHKMAQRSLPFIAFGAGLPQLAGLAGEAKSYSERLFEYPEVGPLAAEAAKDAIREPMRREGVNISEGALDQIVEKTRGYPYFLQEWGYHAWNVATSSPVTPEDAERATADALERLDKGFFRVRLDRLTPREKDYVRAMAALGPGPHRSGEIAQRLSMDVTTAGPLRDGVIKKGMVYSPQHGDTAFTIRVPALSLTSSRRGLGFLECVAAWRQHVRRCWWGLPPPARCLWPRSPPSHRSPRTLPRSAWRDTAHGRRAARQPRVSGWSAGHSGWRRSARRRSSARPRVLRLARRPRRPDGIGRVRSSCAPGAHPPLPQGRPCSITLPARSSAPRTSAS